MKKGGYASSGLDVNNVFAFVVFVGEGGEERPGFSRFLEGAQFALQVAAFQTDEAVGQGVALAVVDVLTDEGREIVEFHHGAGHNEVELLLFLNGVAVGKGYVLQADGFSYGLGYAYFLANAVYEMETAFGEEYSQRYAGEAAACTYVHDFGAGPEMYSFGDAETVEYVVLVEVVDVAA